MSYFTEIGNELQGTITVSEDSSNKKTSEKVKDDDGNNASKTTDKKTTFHLIRSVKGGSGKTTFALHKAMDLATTQHEGEKGKVLYIDADVHASETMNMLVKKPLPPSASILKGTDVTTYQSYQFKDESEDPSNPFSNIKKHTLNTYMYPYLGYYSSINDIIHKSIINNIGFLGDTNKQPSTEVGMVDFIFSDYTKNGRSIFENMYQSYGKAVVGVGAYTAKMKSIIQYAIAHKYTDVIIDMPPGSDTFSSHLAEIVIEFSKGDKCNLYIYYVVNDDIYHFNAAKTAIMEHMHVMRSNSARRIILVYNIGRDRNQASASANTDKGKSAPTRETVISRMTNNESKTIEKFELSRITVEIFKQDYFYYRSTMSDSANDANAAPAFWPESRIVI